MGPHIQDFAYIFKGKVMRSFPKEDAHLLLPIDEKITKKHDRALLFLHGYASSPAAYRALIPLIQGYDRIVCPVLPGHGESIQAFAKAQAKDWQQAVKDCCAELVASYEHVSVVGLSLGGLLAIELSHLFDLAHLYLLSPSLKLRFSASWYLYLARVLKGLGLKSIVNHGGNFFVEGYQEISYRRLPISSLIEILSLIHTQDYPKPLCPTDLFLGKHDNVIDPQSIAAAYQHQPLVKLHWLNHSAHVLSLDGDIEYIAQIINQSESFPNERPKL